MKLKRNEKRSKSFFNSYRTVLYPFKRKQLFSTRVFIKSKQSFYPINRNTTKNNFIKPKKNPQIRNLKLFFKKKEKKIRDKIKKENTKIKYNKIHLNLIKNEIKIFLRNLNQFFILKNKNKFSQKKFFKLYIKNKKIDNKKFKYIFSNINSSINKNFKELKYSIYCLLFFSECDFNLLIVNKKKINLQNKKLDKIFFNELKKFTNFLKVKIDIINNKKIKDFENQSEKMIFSIKNMVDKKTIQIKNFRIKKKSFFLNKIISKKNNEFPDCNYLKDLNKPKFDSILNYNNKLREFLDKSSFRIN